jgi:hypothetical protein
MRAHTMIDILTSFKVTQNLSAENLLINLYDELYERDFFGIDDLILVREWIACLHGLQYSFKKLME